MNAIDFKIAPFTISNHYQSNIPSAEDTVTDTAISKIQENIPKEEQAKIQDYADRVTNWGKTLLFRDHEWNILFTGKVAEILDWSVFTTILGLNGAVLIHKIYLYCLKDLPIFHNFPFLLKVISIPSSVFVLVLGIFEGIAESVNTYRGFQFFNNIKQRKDNPLEGLEWLKKRYFTLEKSEGNKIQKYIDKTLPNLSGADKAKRFEQIAEKALQIKYECLKRRVTPGLAQEVLTQLNSIMNDMKSDLPEIKAAANGRAELLMQSLTRQGRNKIIIHMIGLIGVGISLLSFLSIFLVGPLGIAFGVLDALAIPLALSAFLYERRTVKREADNFKKTIEAQSASSGDPKLSPKESNSSLTVSKDSPESATSSS
ncbi:MAG: hypothetical protein KR126chlam3_00645 [Chlamydiae bacterium]|nr:hypothetical protein [Chlamydiota bacterium]